MNAMKNTDRMPVVVSTLASILLVHEAGSVSSKPPKNEIANTTSSRKNMMLNTADVARSFIAEAPNNAVITSPSSTYMTTIDTP